ncbi:DUF1127 domain-containing protein [Falsiroseomonas selenitidurans]|uniref:DUF1127 domain-containing protein n=1 Tax=Falsiroseomonas selenitidurans TaxID=2716335 RepID=A0ABX1E353_9PROT|nr:DUF1127 domain-containing protein [Falsiroseomonas selenitidurans]NKC31110.1 DUF1127 domain-containing protein [Falsiroseomonas selenitidurans]
MHIPHPRSLSATPDLISSIQSRRPDAALPRLARQLWSWVVRHQRARIAEAELAARSDHLLADIGVRRSELARAARRGRRE